MSGNNSSETAGAFSQAACFQRDLYLYLREAREANGLPLTTRGYVSRPALRRVRAALLAVDGRAPVESDADSPEGADAQLFFMRRLLERLGLVRLDNAPERATQRLVAASQDVIAAYFARPLAERLRLCVRMWIGGGWWPDAPDARATVAGVMAPAAPRVALTRRRLIESLSAMRPGEALAIPTVAMQHAPSSQRPGVSARRTAHPLELADETVRAALLGPLAWLGLMRVDDAQPTRCVIEGACGALAPSSDAELAEAHGRVTMQPDLSIVAYPPLTAPLLVALDLYAEPVRLDVAARYRLSRAAMARSGRGSLASDVVAERLERLTGAPLPENVRVTLRDWERQGERLSVVERACVLEVDEPTLLDALLADRVAHGWIERRLSATAALTASAHVANVRAWLLRRGELPATLNGTQQHADHPRRTHFP
jgi:hypothetical protein